MNTPQNRCEEVVKFIIECEPNVFKELNVKTLARKYGVDRCHLSRSFKKYKGIYLSEYITRLRMIKSAFMLMENRNTKIWQIAHLFGWNHKSTFVNAFKKFFGISPGKFRKLIVD